MYFSVFPSGSQCCETEGVRRGVYIVPVADHKGPGSGEDIQAVGIDTNDAELVFAYGVEDQEFHDACPTSTSKDFTKSTGCGYFSGKSPYRTK